MAFALHKRKSRAPRHHVGLYLEADEYGKLAAVAKKAGISVSETVRQMMRHCLDEMKTEKSK